MRFRFPVGLAALLLTTTPVLAAMPSFDCLKATTPIDKLICADGGLAALDAKLGKAFAKRKAALAPDAFKAELARQREWIARRGVACSIPVVRDWASPQWPRAAMWKATECLAPLYRARLAELGAPIADAPPNAAKPGVLHPMCLGIAAGIGANEASPLALEPCAAGNAHNPPVVRDGWIEADGTMDSPIAAFVGYRDAGVLPDGRTLLVLAYSGGGSGDFSSLLAVKRQTGPDGTLLTATALPGGGDRCENGIETATVRDGAILLTQRVHPALFLAAAEKAAGLKERETDLAACAACCVGATTTRMTADGKNPAVVSARLDGDGHSDDSAHAPPEERCFLRAVAASARALPHDYSLGELAAFAKAFHACLGR